MYGPQRIFSCRNPSPKTVGNVAKRRSVHFGVYNVRLLSALDKLLRDKPRYLGELSTSINDALLAVDLNTVELVNLQSRQKQTGRETQVVILRRLRNRIHQVAQKRKCSMNQLVNSALLAYYSKTEEGELKRSTRRRGGIHAFVRQHVGGRAAGASPAALRAFSNAISLLRCRKA